MGKKRIISKASSVEEVSKIQDTIKNTEAKSTKAVKKGIIFINATFNNTMIQVSDEKGNIVATSSAGSIGFKGTKKSTPFAASKVAEVVIEKIKKQCPLEVEVRIKGIGKGRESALRTLITYGAQYNLSINTVLDVTPMPHNGPKARKPRRM